MPVDSRVIGVQQEDEKQVESSNCDPTSVYFTDV